LSGAESDIKISCIEIPCEELIKKKHSV